MEYFYLNNNVVNKNKFKASIAIKNINATKISIIMFISLVFLKKFIYFINFGYLLSTSYLSNKYKEIIKPIIFIKQIKTILLKINIEKA